MNEYIAAIIGICLTVIVGLIYRFFFRRFIRNSTRLLRNNPTSYRFLGYVTIALIYVVGFSWSLYQIEGFKTMSASLLTGAGILAAAVGFASQAALSNIMSGIFIIIFKPYKLRDRVFISEGNIAGEIEDITLRHTVIRNYENQRVLIPNSIMSDSTILNADHIDQKVLKWVEFDISYDSDIDLARSIIQEKVENHPLFIDGRTEEQKQEEVPLVPVRVIELGSTYVRLRAWVWTSDHSNSIRIKFELFESVKKAFDENGIEIPYPYRNIVWKENKKKEIEK